ncbi:MAG: hypothetical protein ACTSUY_05830 [Alphaproteobacteria bacterium]
MTKSTGQLHAIRKAMVLAGLVALALGAGACSAQQEVVRMPELTGLPAQPLPLPPPATVMTISQKNAAIAQMQAAAKKNSTLAN